MNPSAGQRYDRIGVEYARTRRADVRIARAIAAALAGAGSIVNVGSGTGSYEPADREVVAVEPSTTMIGQRAPSAAPVVRAVAESLPFGAGAFQASLSVLSLHHWSDWRTGLRELVRVSRRRVVLMTWDPESQGFWLMTDYFPEMLAADRLRFPTLGALRSELGEIEATPIPIPHDCADGFLGAYWRRPRAYLDPQVRRGISSMAAETSAAGLARLGHDLASGAWERRHGHLLGRDTLEMGYRLVTASVALS